MSGQDVVAIYPTGSTLKLQGNWTDLTVSGDSIYGMLEAGQPVESVYSVDGVSPNTYAGPSNVAQTQSEVEFFISPMLSAGEHQLVFNVTNATADSLFILEFILYQGTGTVTTGAAGESATATSIATDAGAATTPSAVAASAGFSSANVGAIVGGVVGGMAGLAIIGLLVFFWWRGHNRRPYFSAPAGELLQNGKYSMLSGHLKPKPFAQCTAGGPGVAYQTKPQMSGDGGPAWLQYVVQIQPNPPSEAGGSSAYSSSGNGSRPPLTVIGGPPQARSKAAEAGLLSVWQRPTYHADSGVRFDAMGQPSGSAGPSHEADAHTPTDVPPSYSEN
ncbi:hypothetical protein DAEQUDRAFT_736654 [Daedalea quercina L-15889]|uniref:Mid2 domain-containing protein n=1 Tax=Daedalea quercina L-15889 TaxID=1314783 RepID=A0A165S2P2_9APHY|nr:hypothetical protein DAEQUDRAFT_736654 [Daedalea quercina L-15889]